MLKIVDRNNLPIDQSVRSILDKVYSKIKSSSKVISDGLKYTTQRHFQTIYPGSKHYNPNKVTNGKNSNGEKVTGEIVIDVPGITRAYKDLNISAINRKYLTIPLHKEAYGKKASDFKLFFLENKKGNKFLAQKSGKGITLMYLLRKSVHQKQDKKLMPSDETFAVNVFARLIRQI